MQERPASAADSAATERLRPPTSSLIAPKLGELAQGHSRQGCEREQPLPIGRMEQGTPNAPNGQVAVLPPITRTPEPLYGPAMLLSVGAGSQRIPCGARRIHRGGRTQLVISRGAVPINPGSAADHGLVVLEGAPGEAKGRLEFLGVVLRRSAARTENRIQVCRDRYAVGVESGLRIPRQAVVQSEVRFDLPDILGVEAVLIVVSMFWHVIIRARQKNWCRRRRR